MSDVYSEFLKNKYDPNDFYETGIAPQTANYGSIGSALPVTGNRTSKLSRGGYRLESSRDGSFRPMTRPSTSLRPVGYTSEAGKMFDNLHASQRKTIIIENKKDDIPEERYRNLEIKITTILEQSIMLATDLKPDYNKALAKAKEASSLDRTLHKIHEQNVNGNFHHNYELTYLVLFNLAQIYTMNEMYIEALNTYNLITKNKMFPNGTRLKMNMGNIYYEMGMYSKSIKMYRMALDQVPPNQKELRLKITHNIGIILIKMGQYSDAATSFEFIMSEICDFKTGLHLILCYYALGDANELKRSFQMLLDIPMEFENDKEKFVNLLSNNNFEYIYEIIKSDELYSFENGKKNEIEKNILMSSMLISSIIDDSFDEGYNWCLETIKNSNYNKLAFDLELNKSIMLLKTNNVQKAIENLKYFEKKEQQLATNATINLTFIYLLKNEKENYMKYSEIAKTKDSYNPATYINRGYAELMDDNIIKAKIMFDNALDIDATSFEALYNLGLVFKRMGEYEQSIAIFHKIQSTIGHELHPQVIYQIANLYELLNDISGSLEWYFRLLGLVNFDPGIYKKIAQLYEKENERQHAFQNYYESFKIYPVDLEIVDWIGTHFIDLQKAEKAVTFYQKTVAANPNDPYYLIRISNCFNKVGNKQKAFQLLQIINKKFPDDLNCLRALVYMCHKHSWQNLYDNYLTQYQALEKAKETRQRVGSSRPTTTTGKRKQSSAKSITSITDGSVNSDTGDNDGIKVSTITYGDHLGPLSERPMTGMRREGSEAEIDEDFNADDLLPI